jgi:uncharacterized protein YuzE
MALTETEVESYVKLATSIKQLPRKDFYASYDAEADVLYINFNNPAQSASDSELTEDDILIRYNDAGQMIGLTILHASKR